MNRTVTMREFLLIQAASENTTLKKYTEQRGFTPYDIRQLQNNVMKDSVKETLLNEYKLNETDINRDSTDVELKYDNAYEKLKYLLITDRNNESMSKFATSIGTTLVGITRLQKPLTKILYLILNDEFPGEFDEFYQNKEYDQRLDTILNHELNDIDTIYRIRLLFPGLNIKSRAPLSESLETCANLSISKYIKLVCVLKGLTFKQYVDDTGININRVQLSDDQIETISEYLDIKGDLRTLGQDLSLKEKLDLECLKRKINMKEVIDQTGLSRMTLHSNIRILQPSDDTYERLSEFFDIPVNDLKEYSIH